MAVRCFALAPIEKHQIIVKNWLEGIDFTKIHAKLK